MRACVRVCETEAVHLQQTEAVNLKEHSGGHGEAEEAASKGHGPGLKPRPDSLTTRWPFGEGG